MRLRTIIILSVLIIVALISYWSYSVKQIYDNFKYEVSIRGVDLSGLGTSKSIIAKLLLKLKNPTKHSVTLRDFKLLVYSKGVLIADSKDNDYTKNFSVLQGNTSYNIDINVYFNKSLFLDLKSLIVDNKVIRLDYTCKFKVLGIIPFKISDYYELSKKDFQ